MLVASASCESGPPAPAPFDTSPVAVENTSSALDDRWRLGPFMQIYVRAYRDSDGDGEGDLQGVIEKLDYLEALGVRGLWLLPIMPSQDSDHGYMVTDYRDVHPDYGSLETLDALLAAAHARGIGVILDYVVNHSARQHPAFADAARSIASPWRDWYVWSPSHQAGWTSVSNGDPWRQAATGWYYASFIEDMPDFNWKNPDVAAYHQSSFRAWLNRGVDGFRIDAAQLLVENGPRATADQPETLAALAALRGVVDGYANRFLVCEAPGSPAIYAAGSVCGGAFGFTTNRYQLPTGDSTYGQQIVLAALGDPASTTAVAQYPYTVPVGELATLLANHDRFAGKRLWNTFGGDTPGYRLAAATLMLMPGVPFLYYGEEIGMAEIPLADPATDFHQRGAMSWTGDPGNAGFSSVSRLDGPRAIRDPAYRYLKPAPNAAIANVATEAGDPGSLLSHYRALIALRNAHAALSRGSYELLASTGAGLVFRRSHAEEEVVVAINYGGAATPLVPLAGLAASASYTSLFAYGAAATTLTTSALGNASLALPAQSVQVLHLARPAPPFGVAMYVRGSMHDWADPPPPSAQLVYDGGTTYSQIFHLRAGDHIFKVAPAIWSLPMLNFGAVDGRVLVLGKPVVLEQTAWKNGGVGADVHLSAPSDGDYRFSVDAANVLAPQVTVTRLP